MTTPAQLRVQNQALTRDLKRATTKIKYLKIALALMTGVIAALVTYLVVRGLDATPLLSVGWSASAFIVTTGFVFTVQEKIAHS
ncbi:hypothetical protein [Streptomyces sp. NBC_00525]|uniref:hypothetical protein n=1 Tax=Streptomyces sp. NBC_00525 TaxID=2903660 RepID=UPI002E808215|nr:hypothetical protein [Streptomyces sp. NBC_00525]WUC92184.1 hypothetical protein OG710_00545 [Streptomyces sp. NBC_00525]